MKTKITVQKMTFRDNFGGVALIIHKVMGLPDGYMCNYSPEESHKPRGEWFVATQTPRVKNRAVKRFGNREDAEGYALDWATKKMKVPRPAKRGVK